MKIAMWSGPRNLSTAMLYSFAARLDFEVMDEPFYAPYLAASGSRHPMRDQIISAHESDPKLVANTCNKPPAQHLYMKHMPHHMLPSFPLAWAKDCVNIHLVRHPARVIASYAAKREMPTLNDIGFPQQLDLIERLGGYLIDSHDIRRDPNGMLTRLCEAVGIPFDPAMLCWPAGPKPFDGIWAAHWYDAVHRSTGFAGPEGPEPVLTGAAAALCKEALPIYRAMWDRAEALI